MWQHVKLSDGSLGTRPRYILVVDEDVKKPTNQKNNFYLSAVDMRVTPMAVASEMKAKIKKWCEEAGSGVDYELRAVRCLWLYLIITIISSCELRVKVPL